jgi:hypothetical protein
MPLILMRILSQTMFRWTIPPPTGVMDLIQAPLLTTNHLQQPVPWP